MGIKVIARCALDPSITVNVHADDDGDIWISHSEALDSVMLSPEDALNIGNYLIELANVQIGRGGSKG